MRSFTIFRLTGLFSLVSTMLIGAQLHSQAIAQTVPEKYVEGVNDASHAESGENVSTLIPISPNNKQLVWSDDGSQILVLTWKSQNAYDNFIKPATQTSDSEDYVTWVTVAPQIKEFCQEYLKNNPQATTADLNQRLKEHLGLNPNWNYDVFVEMWVSPEDLFRPCPDPEIGDRQCNLSFTKVIPKVKNIANYQQFYTNLYFKSFRDLPGVPWTGLGYTYDWGSPVTEVGASEFILVPKSKYAIYKVESTENYCRLN